MAPLEAPQPEPLAAVVHLAVWRACIHGTPGDASRLIHTYPDAVGMAYDNEGAAILPETFSEALDALEKDDALRTKMSQELINVFMVLKRDEIARYEAAVDDPNTREVTDWEITEYAASY